MARKTIDETDDLFFCWAFAYFERNLVDFSGPVSDQLSAAWHTDDEEAESHRERLNRLN
jgi:hypothetical protein